MANVDLDKSGSGYQRLRTYLGPSLGWTEEFVQPATFVTAGGPYDVQAGDSLLLVNVNAPVQINLPDLRKWVAQTANQPATAFARYIVVKDFGGFANTSNIVIVPFGIQLIDGMGLPFIISQAKGIVRFVPMIDYSGWIVETNLVASGGQGGTGTVNPVPPVSASNLAAFADSSGTLIKGTIVAGPGIELTLAATNILQLDDNMQSLAAWNGLEAIPYRFAPGDWRTVNLGSGIQFSGGALAVTQPLAALNSVAAAADKLPYFTGINTAAVTDFTVAGRTLVGQATTGDMLTAIGAQPLDADLTSLAAASATNNIYYRSAANTWSPVSVGSGLSFTGGLLSATGSGTGSVNTSGPVTTAQLAGYADATGNLIQGISMPAAGLTRSGANLVLANDLAALEALAGTNNIYYRSGVDTWSSVTIGTGLTFTGGTLAASAGGGNVSNVGTPVNNQLAVWTAATTIEGDAKLTYDGSSFAVGDSTVNGLRISPQAAGNTQCLINAAGVDASISLSFSSKGALGYNFYTNNFGQVQVQIAHAVGATRSLVLAGSAGGRPTITASAGGAVDVQDLTAGTGRSWFNSPLTIGNVTAGTWLNLGLELEGTTQANASFDQGVFIANNTGPAHYFSKSRGSSFNTWGAVQAGDQLGIIVFRGSDASTLRDGGYIQCIANGAPVGTRTPCYLSFTVTNAAGVSSNPLAISATGVDILGANHAAAPAAGMVGELLTVTGSAVGVGVGVWTSLIGMNLTAGDWDIWGFVTAGPGSAGSSSFTVLSITSTPNSGSVTGVQIGNVYTAGFANGAGEFYFQAPVNVARVAATTTYYLSAATNIATPVGFIGTIAARRRR